MAYRVFVFLLILFSMCHAQFQFQRTIGGFGDDRIWSIVQTSDGGYGAAGETSSFGAGGQDFYFIKLDSAGMIQWSKTIGGMRNETAQSLILTNDGAFVMAGFSNSFGTLKENDIMIVKLNSTGTVLWTKTIRSTEDELAVSLIQTADGGYGFIGHTNTIGAADYDCLIVKLDSGGTIQWSKIIGGPRRDFGYSLKQTSDGGYIITGYSDSFGGEIGAWDMYIVKLNSGGNIQWGRTIGGPGTDAGYSIIQTSDGGYLATGYTFSFGAGYVDIYFVKLDSDGGLEWTKTAGGTNSDVAYSIIQTPDGGFAAAGYTNSFGAGLMDICVLKLNAEGTIQWCNTIGGTFYDDAWTIKQASDNGFIIGGRSNSFGNPGNYDLYIAKLSATGNSCSNINNITISSGSGGTITAINPSAESIASVVITQSPVIGSGGVLSVVCTAVGIQPVSNEIPSSYELYQNYPNPFNPSTKIRFEIPLLRGVDAEGGRDVFTQIIIYDISGRLIETIINENLIPGTYEIEWNASKYSSGVYFYKIVSGDYVNAKKMLMIK